MLAPEIITSQGVRVRARFQLMCKCLIHYHPRSARPGSVQVEICVNDIVLSQNVRILAH